MDYEKKYKDAVKKLEKFFINSDDRILYKHDIENVFPELKESEDKNIKKSLIGHLKECRNNTRSEVMLGEYAKWIAWLEKQDEQKEINLVEILKHYPRETELYSPLYGKLWLAEVDEEHEIITCYKYPLEEDCTRAILEQEDTVSFYSNGTTGLPDFNVSKDCMLFLYDSVKQGEQKSTSADKVESKFKVGDWVTNGIDLTFQVRSIEDNMYLRSDEYFIDIETADKTFRLWTIQDAKDGDVLAVDGGSGICIFDGTVEDGIYPFAYCGLTRHYGFEVYDRRLPFTHDNNVYPATKEQRDLLFSKMKEAGYEWDAEKKELKNNKI